MSDAAEQSQAAPQPATRGLQPLHLVAESYQLDAVQAIQTRLLNFYPEKLPPGARSDFLLKPTPGLEVYTSVGTGPIRASATLAGAMWVVSGTQAWVKPDSDQPAIFLGDVGYPVGAGNLEVNGTVTIAVGLTGVVICVPPRAYVVDFDPVTPSFNEIVTGSPSDPDLGWPAEGVSSVCYLDGYYVFSSFAGDRVFWSSALNPMVYDSLDYFRLSSDVDYIEQVVAHNGELWLFGQNLTRVYYNTGQVDSLFQRRVGALMPHGYGSRRTIQSLDGSLFWLGIDNMVYRSKGYTAVRVSNHALEEILEDYQEGFLRTAVACAFYHEGHSFYALSLPEAGDGRTFVYDAATGRWHERCSAVDGIGRWQINTCSPLSARNVLGSAVDGTLYHQKSDVKTENGVQVRRQAILPALITHGPRAFMARLEVEMEMGTPAANSLQLDWSNDGGVTYTDPRTLTGGGVGATRARLVATRLGSFRHRALRLTTNDAPTIYGVDADVQAGST